MSASHTASDLESQSSQPSAQNPGHKQERRVRRNRPQSTKADTRKEFVEEVEKKPHDIERQKQLNKIKKNQSNYIDNNPPLIEDFDFGGDVAIEEKVQRVNQELRELEIILHDAGRKEVSENVSIFRSAIKWTVGNACKYNPRLPNDPQDWESVKLNPDICHISPLRFLKEKYGHLLGCRGTLTYGQLEKIDKSLAKAIQNSAEYQKRDKDVFVQKIISEARLGGLVDEDNPDDSFLVPLFNLARKAEKARKRLLAVP